MRIYFSDRRKFHLVEAYGCVDVLSASFVSQVITVAGECALTAAAPTVTTCRALRYTLVSLGEIITETGQK